MLKHLTFVAALMLPVAAFAQAADADIFSTLDANADGAVTMEEAQADQMVVQGFTAADVNQDGNLSAEEYEAAFGTQG